MTASRRRFLVLGGAGALALGAAGIGLSLLARGYALRPGEVALGLGVKELCIARAIVEALLPGGDGMPSGLELSVHQRIDEQVWAAEPALRSDMRAALQLLEHAPPLFGVFHRLTALSPGERVEVLQRMQRSKREVFVQAATAFKQLSHMLYYASPEVWTAIGYDGPWVKAARPPESARRYAELFRARTGAS